MMMRTCTTVSKRRLQNLTRRRSFDRQIQHQQTTTTLAKREPLRCHHSSRFYYATTYNSSKQGLHSSATSQKSTLIYKNATTKYCDIPPFPSVLLNSNAPTPPFSALRALFIVSAIPMVGFGFMDNLVMIQAGQYIDSTLGVTLGLATLTAAAAGQVVSDVSGVLFGGTLERLLHIQPPALTAAQLQLPICRNTSLAGAVVGVMVGCALGATCLLFMDLEARDRIDRAGQLQDIVSDMINNGNDADPPENATLYVCSKEDFDVQGLEQRKSSRRSKIRMRLLTTTTTIRDEVLHQAIDERRTVLAVDGNVLYAPILVDGKVVAVMKLVGDNFDQNDDVLTAEVMSRHIGIFMKRLAQS